MSPRAEGDAVSAIAERGLLRPSGARNDIFIVGVVPKGLSDYLEKVLGSVDISTEPDQSTNET